VPDVKDRDIRNREFRNRDFRKWSDWAILTEVAQWRLGVPVLLTEWVYPKDLFPDREEALKRIKDSLGHLVRFEKLAWQRLPYSKERFYTLGRQSLGDAVDRDLACLFTTRLGYERLKKTDVDQQIPDPPHHHIRHLGGRDKQDGKPFIASVYPPKLDLEPKRILANIRERVAKLRSSEETAGLVARGSYGLLVLVSEEHLTELKAAVGRRKRNEYSLGDQCRIEIERQITAATAAEEIRRITESGDY